MTFYKKPVKFLLKTMFGLDAAGFIAAFSKWQLRLSLIKQKDLLKTLRTIVPDVSKQYTRTKEDFNDYWELKIRGLHAFQCSLMLKALESAVAVDSDVSVVDIGDSSGAHMLYLKALTKDRHTVRTLSVNLDEKAVEKIRGKGLEALLCRAEDLDLGQKKIDLCVSFEMLEHLHDPAYFLYNLAQRSDCARLLITVPYQKRSQVGLRYIKNGRTDTIHAEDEHIFELSPEDWYWLMLHSGWRIVYQEVYYQYPRNIPLISRFMAFWWRKTDFEGFFGAILKKDARYSGMYADWKRGAAGENRQ